MHVIYRNQTSLHHLLQNKLNVEYFTCYKFKTVPATMHAHGNAYLPCVLRFSMNITMWFAQI